MVRGELVPTHGVSRGVWGRSLAVMVLEMQQHTTMRTQQSCTCCLLLPRRSCAQDLLLCLLLDVAQGLLYVHSSRVVHCDVKWEVRRRCVGRRQPPGCVVSLRLATHGRAASRSAVGRHTSPEPLPMTPAGLHAVWPCVPCAQCRQAVSLPLLHALGSAMCCCLRHDGGTTSDGCRSLANTCATAAV